MTSIKESMLPKEIDVAGIVNNDEEVQPDPDLRIWDTELLTYQKSIDRLRIQRDQVEKLKLQSKTTEEELLRYRTENNNLSIAMDAMKLQVFEKSQLETKLKASENRVVQLEDALAHAQSTAAAEKTQSQELQSTNVATIARLTTKIASLEQQNSTLQLDLDSASSDRQTLLQRATAAEASLQNLQSTFDEKFRDRTIELMERERELVCEVMTLKTELKHVRGQGRAAELGLKELEKANESQANIIEQCEADYDAYKSKFEAAAAEHASEVSKRSVLENTLERESREFAKRVTSLEGQLSVESDKLCQALQELATARVFIEELVEEKESMSQELLSLRNLEDETTRCMAWAREQLNSLNELCKVQDGELRHHVLALKDVKDQKAILVDKIDTLQGQITKEREDRAQWATARLQLLSEFGDALDDEDGSDKK